MKQWRYGLAPLMVLAVVACVTINIYFPAEEVRGVADKIVEEVWGERGQPSEAPPQTPQEPGSFYLRLLQPQIAYAAQDIDVSTPAIRAIRASLKARSAALFPYLDSGHVGIGSDGLLKIRSAEGLALKARGEVNRLLQAENQERLRLYQEIATANGFPDRATDVQAIFAESWRQQAASGWYLEQDDGWSRK